MQDANGKSGTAEDNGPAELAALQLIGYSLAGTPSTAAPPLTAATVTGPQGQNGYYTGPVKVTLTSQAQASPVTGTFFSVDGDVQQAYSAPFTVSGEGSHMLMEDSTDAAGETEVPNDVEIKIDAVKPVTTGTLTGRKNSAGAYLGQATVTLAATDDLSGIEGTSYSADGAPAQVYTNLLTVSAPGQHTVTFFSTDVAGNKEAARTLTFTVTPPPVLNTLPAGLQMLSVPETYTSALQGLSPAPAKMAFWDPVLAQYTFSGSTDSLMPGRGYWATLRQPTGVMDTGAALPTTVPFAINLVKGWNMIGDPFLSAVPLAGVQVRDVIGTQGTFQQAVSGGVLSGTLYAYPAGSTQYQYVGVGGKLSPFEGYWVYAFHACTLLVPSH